MKEIPFDVTSNQTVTEALHFEQTVFKDEFDAKMIRQTSTSPDGKMIAFNAAGYIYTKTLPDGEPNVSLRERTLSLSRILVPMASGLSL